MQGNFILTNRGRANFNVGVVILSPGVPKTVPLNLTQDLLAHLNKVGIHVAYRTPTGQVLINNNILDAKLDSTDTPSFRKLTMRESAEKIAGGPGASKHPAVVLAELNRQELLTKLMEKTVEVPSVIEEAFSKMDPIPDEAFNDILNIIHERGLGVTSSTKEVKAESSKEEAETQSAVQESTTVKYPLDVQIKPEVLEQVKARFGSDEAGSEEQVEDTISIPDEDDLKAMHGQSVKKLCRDLGLSDAGTKAELIEILLMMKEEREAMPIYKTGDVQEGKVVPTPNTEKSETTEKKKADKDDSKKSE